MTPLERLPRSSQIRIEDQEGGRGGRLHLPVHYNKTNAETIGGSGWKQTLDPIVQKDEKYPRKEETFTIYSPDTTDTESNDNMEIFWEKINKGWNNFFGILNEIFFCI